MKDLPDSLRLGFANLVLAMADNDLVRTAESLRWLQLLVAVLSNFVISSFLVGKKGRTMLIQCYLGSKTQAGWV